MKIALINSEYPSPSGHDHGGIATYTYTLASALHQQGHRVHVFIREGTVPDRLAEGVKIHTYNFKPPRSSRRILNRFQDGIVQWELGHARDIRDQLNAFMPEKVSMLQSFQTTGASPHSVHKKSVQSGNQLSYTLPDS